MREVEIRVNLVVSPTEIMTIRFVANNFLRFDLGIQMYQEAKDPHTGNVVFRYLGPAKSTFGGRLQAYQELVPCV